MERSSKRGKIPQSDWPSIMARYEAGETLSSIARTYDCSPPAISYVVSRSRARPAAAVSLPPLSAEPQLVKSPHGEHPAADGASTSSSTPTNLVHPTSPPATEPFPVNGLRAESKSATEPVTEPPGDNWLRGRNGFGNGNSAATPQPHGAPTPQPVSPPLADPENANGDPRRTLHLSLGNGPQPGNGSQLGDGSQPTDSPPSERHQLPEYQAQPQQHPFHDRAGSGSLAAPQHGPIGSDHARPITAPAGLLEPSRSAYPPPPVRSQTNGSASKEGAMSYIDRELRARVDDDIAAFLTAFDAALAQDTQESRASLREATDRLLRAGARTRIELERLEARMPLPRRDAAPQSEPAWRHR